MLLYSIKNEKIIKENSEKLNESVPHLYLIDDIHKSVDLISKLTNLPNENIIKELEIHHTRFESHEHLDLICAKDYTQSNIIHIFLQEENMIISCTNTFEFENLINKINSESVSNLNFDKIIFCVFSFFIEQNNNYFDTFENRITKLDEDILLKKQNNNFFNEIVQIRKQIMNMKRFYQQISDVFSYIDENENAFFNEKTLKLFKILASKVDRMYHNIISLSDYISQIHESYQSDIDITLNKTMNLFTIIAAIFMPLTLITSWYGMNLQMPEFGMKFAYPIIIGICVFIIVFCIIIFKKKKWF